MANMDTAVNNILSIKHPLVNRGQFSVGYILRSGIATDYENGLLE